VPDAPTGRCFLCPRACGADREAGETGVCGAPAEIVVASAGPHFGEESVLVGPGGSGTIFLSGCSLRCPYCQNADIAHAVRGAPLDAAEAATLMLRLAASGCANVNLVTPTHFAAPLADAIREARRRGLAVPVVWNCGGYESLATLRTLEGLVEIYMPDFKLWDPERAARLLDAPDYPAVAREAILEMQRQVGDLRTGPDGLARQGLLVRHLVMPGGAADGAAIVDFLADEVSPRTYVNVMEQYRPAHRAHEHPDIDRRPTRDEIEAVREHARTRGLRLAG
jgi:putative pyruvate formate lyase activating enzyme